MTKLEEKLQEYNIPYEHEADESGKSYIYIEDGDEYVTAQLSHVSKDGEEWYIVEECQKRFRHEIFSKVDIMGEFEAFDRFHRLYWQSIRDRGLKRNLEVETENRSGVQFLYYVCPECGVRQAMRKK